MYDFLVVIFGIVFLGTCVLGCMIYKKHKSRRPYQKQILPFVIGCVLTIALAFVSSYFEPEEMIETATPIPEDESLSAVEDVSTKEIKGEDITENDIKEEVKFNVDWDACIAEAKEELLNPEYFDYVKDLYIEVNETEKYVTFTASFPDSINPQLVLDYADTVIRRFNLIANSYDSNIALATKDTYGGLYDEYWIKVGFFPFSKSDNPDEWFIFDMVSPGLHTKQPIELKKQYR